MKELLYYFLSFPQLQEEVKTYIYQNRYLFYKSTRNNWIWSWKIKSSLALGDRVTVGGIVDTRNPKKPLSTNVKITGRTFEGKTSTHTFTLGDETSMAANVCGTAFGYLKAGISLHRRGIHGLFTAAEIMPQFVRQFFKKLLAISYQLLAT